MKRKKVHKMLPNRIRVFNFEESESRKGRAKRLNVGMRKVVQQATQHVSLCIACFVIWCRVWYISPNWMCERRL